MGNAVQKLLHKGKSCPNKCKMNVKNHDKSDKSNEVSAKLSTPRVHFSESIDEQSSLVTLNAKRRPTTALPLKRRELKEIESSDDSDVDDMKIKNLELTANSNVKDKRGKNNKQQFTRHSQPGDIQRPAHVQERPEKALSEELGEVETSDDEELLDGGKVTIKSLEMASDVEGKEKDFESEDTQAIELEKSNRNESGFANQSVEVVKQKIAKVFEQYKNITESDVAKAFQEVCNEVPIFQNISAAQVFEIIQGDESQKKENSLEMEVKRLQMRSESDSIDKSKKCLHKPQFESKPEGAESALVYGPSFDVRLQKRIEDALGTRPVEFMNPVVKEKLVEVIEHHKNMAESEAVKAFKEACNDVPFFNNLTPAQVFQIVQDDMTSDKNIPFEDAFNRLLDRLQSSANRLRFQKFQ